MGLRQLAAGQSPYALINALFAAVAPASLWAIDDVGTTGLTLSLYGGNVLNGGTVTAVADQPSLALTASATNYVEADLSGLATTSGVRLNTSGWTAGYVRLYQITTDGSGITAITRYPTWCAVKNPLLALSMTSDANKTLSQAEAMADVLQVTSTVSLTATRDLIVPLIPREWMVFNDTTGAQSIRLIGATGTGTTIGPGKCAKVFANGVNVRRVTADV
jgi:hypothetical protein